MDVDSPVPPISCGTLASERHGVPPETGGSAEDGRLLGTNVILTRFTVEAYLH